MPKTSLIISTAIAGLALFLSLTQPETQLQVPQITLPWEVKAEQCTTKLEIECAIQIERTVRACAKAFETEGADIIADIKCAKDLLADKKFCWPCICAEAKKKGWHVIGC